MGTGQQIQGRVCGSDCKVAVAAGVLSSIILILLIVLIVVSAVLVYTRIKASTSNKMDQQTLRYGKHNSLDFFNSINTGITVSQLLLQT